MKELIRRITLPECDIRLWENGILDYDYTLSGEVGIELARRAVAAGRELVTAPCPTLIRINRVAGVTREARLYFSESEDNQAVVSRVALLIDSPLSRLIGNFFIGINRAPFPTKLFTRLNEAEAWLAAP